MPSKIDDELALVRSRSTQFTAHSSCQLGRGDYSWSLSHLGYLYPGTTPVMIKLDHNRSCPWI